jgi:PAS domain S-box-containing protein
MAFDQPVASVCAYDSATETATTLGSSLPSSVRLESAPDQIPESFVNQTCKREDNFLAAGTPEATVDTDPPKPIQAEALVPVGRDRILRVGVTELDTFDEGAIATIEGIAANLQTALSRIDHRPSSVMRCDVARALFDQSDDAMFVSDTDGTLVAANRAAVKLTGRDRDALLTSALSDIAGDTATEPVREHLEHTVTGATEPLTVTLKHADDGDRTVTLASQQVDVDGTSYIQTIAYDPSSDARLQRGQSGDPIKDDAAVLRRLNGLTVGANELDETIERLLSLGCDHFGLDTGILSHVDEDDYEVDAVVDGTETHEAGTVYDLGDTMCEATLTNDTTETLAFANVADTDYQNHPAAENVRAYIAAPVVVDGDIYGTVNFSMGKPRSEAFRPREKEFIKLVGQWIGAELERRHRFEELERYETILEAVDDPVYALDTEGRFTFVNGAARREFGYGTEIIGEPLAVGMRDADVEQVQEQIEGLLATDRRSATAEFVLETADSGEKTVENRLALIGDDEFRGTAGILRDISGREERRRQLEQFQRAVEEAADGIAVLDGDEYTYVDQSHVDMYGFESKEQLLGNSWRELYDDAEVERLEREAFPALESEGYWRGMVTGSRPDGTTFPAELSLTIIEDGRLVCTVRDETERRRRERELKSRSAAIEAASDGIALLDDDGQYMYVNRAHANSYGYDTPEAFMGESWRMCYSSEECARIESDIMPQLSEHGKWRGEATGYRKDGTTFSQEVSLTSFEHGIICVIRDISARKARERELELKERAMDEASVGIQITDPTEEDNPLVYVNDGFEQMTGYTCEEAIGRNPRFLQGEDTDPERVAKLRDALSAEEPVSLELKNYRNDGTPYWARLSITPVEDEAGTVTNYIGIQQDVTERVERSRRRQEFLNHGPLLFTETREVDGEAVVDSCNDRFLRRLGYDRDEVEGEPLASLYTADSAVNLRGAGYEDALAGEFGMNERTLVDADGNEVHTLLRAVPRQNEVSGTNALFVDISKRKERERQKDATVDVLERVYEVTTDPALSFEEKVDGLLAAGREYLDLPLAFLTQIDRGDDHTGTQTIVESQGPHDLLQPGESCPLPESYCRKTIQNSALTVITEAASAGWAGDPAYETFGLETYIAGAVDAGGDTYGTLCFASREPRTTEFTGGEQSFVNLLRRWVGYELDRRNSREELRQQRERLELTLSGTDTGIAEWDLETDAVTWSDTLVELVGRDVDSVEEFEEAVHPDDRDNIRQDLETMLDTGEPWVEEFRMRQPDGDPLWLRTRAVPTYDDGRPVRVLATGTDITDRKHAERERRRNERRARILAENIPNGAVLSFDANLEYTLAAGELLSAFDLEAPDIFGMEVGTVLPDAGDELVPRFRAALNGERTDRRVELGDRMLRLQLVPIDDSDGASTDTRGLVLAQDVTEAARRERELFAERERFRLLTESVDEYAFLVVDEGGTIQTWSENAEAMFGYDAEAAIGMSMAELHPQADREWVLPDRLLQQAKIAGGSSHEGWRVRADGSTFYADVRYSPLEADDGTFRGYATVVRDMTNRRRQRRRTERFVEESDDVVTIVDPDGTVTYASGSASGVLDHDPDDLVGENLFDYLHPDGREDAMETFFAGVKKPDAEARAEFRIKSGTGEWLNIEGQCRNMLDEDAIDGMLLYLRDVTDRKERSRRFESIFNQTFQFTGLLEPDGTVLEMNNAALEFGGIEHDEIAGELFSDAAWWTHAEAVRDTVRDAIERAANGEFLRYETEVRGADGLATIDFSVKPVTDDDDEVSMLVVEGRDITSRQQHRRHLEVMQRVMRHNMRNDLTKVRGWTQVMSEESDAEKRAEQLETIEEILDKWDAMTEKMGEIRAVLNAQQGGQAQREAEKIVEDAVAPVREEYPEATVQTDVSDAGLQVPSTFLDAVRELVENAAKTSAEATIEVETDRSSDGWTELFVRDDGPGMPDMEASVLETGEETPLNHGQGLGLWMVRMIVTQAGGDVSVESTGNGTAVRLRLPTGRTAEDERNAEKIE